MLRIAALARTGMISPQHLLLVRGMPANAAPLGRLARLYSSQPPPPPPPPATAQSADAGTAERTQPFTMRTLGEVYRAGTPITMVTAYDYTSAILANAAGVDMVLVGDSLGMVVLGHTDTVPVTMGDMIHHTRAVSRALSHSRGRPLIVGDMPFGTYYSADVAVRNAVALVQEGRCDAVKLEGGAHRPNVIAQVAATVSAGIPVMGHIGLTPQTVAALGGFTLQGKTAGAALNLLEDAHALQDAGCFAVVLEMVPGKVAEIITQSLSIPTIGIGAGPTTSGQVLVYHDMLGTFDKFVPSFCKQYAQVGTQIKGALATYCSEVRSRQFPAKEHTPTIKSAELEEFRSLVSTRRLATSSPHNPSSTGGASAQQQRRSFSTSTRTSRQQGQAQIDHALHPPSLAEHPSRKIVVVGGGAMGSLVASKLAGSPDNDVWMVTSWLEQVAAINRAGLSLSATGTAVTTTTTTTTTTTNAAGGEEAVCLAARAPCPAFRAVTPSAVGAVTETGLADIGIVLVKSTSTANAARILGKLVRPGGAILTLQNGMGNVDVIRRTVSDPDIHVLGGVTLNGATMLEAGRCLHTGSAETFLAAPSDHLGQHAAGLELASLLRAAGLQTVVVDSEDAMNTILWGKLLVNAAINPITAILDVQNGSLLKDDSCGRVIKDVVAEVATLAAEAKVKLPYEDPLQQVYKVLRATAPNVSSMLADVRRGVPTEIDNINGFVVLEGEKRHVPTPMNSTLVNLVKNINSKTLSQQVRLGGSTACTSILQMTSAHGKSMHGYGCRSGALARSLSTSSSRTSSGAPPRILSSIDEMRQWRRTLGRGTTVGFVPTMGALHEGHLSLARLAGSHCDVAVASVFVNPSQFENKEDLLKYPRTLATDVELLARENIAAVFAPAVSEMYPADLDRAVTLNVDGANALAEGSRRPGFFNAVATIVTRLFNIVQPDKAFFGQKDAQQCATIRQMVRDLDAPVEIVIGPTLREHDGLAMSSRNVRITREDRPFAKVIYAALSAGEAAIRSGNRNPEAIRDIVTLILRSEPRFRPEYVSISHAISMKEITGSLPESITPQSICISTAGQLGPVRLIDNVLV